MTTPHFYVPAPCQQDTQPRFIVNMRKGAFFMLTDKGDYRAIECYLPGATYKSPEQYADERAKRLLNGSLVIRAALTGAGHTVTGRWSWDGSCLIGTRQDQLLALHNQKRAAA